LVGKIRMVSGGIKSATYAVYQDLIDAYGKENKWSGTIAMYKVPKFERIHIGVPAELAKLGRPLRRNALRSWPTSTPVRPTVRRSHQRTPRTPSRCQAGLSATQAPRNDQDLWIWEGVPSRNMIPVVT
jgi:hypothetical protein